VSEVIVLLKVYCTCLIMFFADMPENVWWTLYVDLISNSQCDYKLDQAL